MVVHYWRRHLVPMSGRPTLAAPLSTPPHGSLALCRVFTYLTRLHRNACTYAGTLMEDSRETTYQKIRPRGFRVAQTLAPRQRPRLGLCVAG